jgi:hypothetical protein
MFRPSGGHHQVFNKVLKRKGQAKLHTIKPSLLCSWRDTHSPLYIVYLSKHADYRIRRLVGLHSCFVFESSDFDSWDGDCWSWLTWSFSIVARVKPEIVQLCTCYNAIVNGSHIFYMTLKTVIVYGRFSIKLLPDSYLKEVTLVHNLDPQIKNPEWFPWVTGRLFDNTLYVANHKTNLCDVNTVSLS